MTEINKDEKYSARFIPLVSRIQVHSIICNLKPIYSITVTPGSCQLFLAGIDGLINWGYDS